MPLKQTSGNLALAGYDDIFKSSVSLLNGERIVEIPLTELHPPEFHPFQVIDNEEMERLVKSIKKYGVREPGLARPLENSAVASCAAGASCSGYELLCGNRRKRACELAGLTSMPIIIRSLDDDNAAIAMVDSNLEQREKLLFSEKAWAYRVKLEALNHSGIKSESLSVDVLVEQTKESKNQIYRLVRLTELVPDLLDKVDTKKLAFNPAVELSYLSRSEQAMVAEAMALYEIKPSLSQAVRLKKMKQSGEITKEMIEAVLSEEKKPPKEEKETQKYSRYFPSDFSASQMDKVIMCLLKAWQAGQTRI